MFGHNFNEQQWVGAMLVMACTSLELFGIGKKQKAEKVDDKKTN